MGNAFDCMTHIMGEHKGYIGGRNIRNFIKSLMIAPKDVCIECGEEYGKNMGDHIRECFGKDEEKAFSLRQLTGLPEPPTSTQ